MKFLAIISNVAYFRFDVLGYEVKVSQIEIFDRNK
jgi:hypothetical protein